MENALRSLDVKINLMEESLLAAKSLQGELKAEVEKLKSVPRKTNGDKEAVSKQHTQSRSVEIEQAQGQITTDDIVATDGLGMMQIGNLSDGHEKKSLYSKITKILGCS